MGKPNIFKAKIAIMGLSSREIIKMLYSRGISATAPELSVAIHGGTQPKHLRIREEINGIYSEWEKS